MTSFPTQYAGKFYLTEGGQETEIMYKFGHDLPEFAMFPLLEKPQTRTSRRNLCYPAWRARTHHGGNPEARGDPGYGSTVFKTREEADTYAKKLQAGAGEPGKAEIVVHDVNR